MRRKLFLFNYCRKNFDCALEKHLSENVKITYPLAGGWMVDLRRKGDSRV